MRIMLSVVFGIILVTLTVCGISAVRTKKTIGYSVALLILGVATPVIGNLIIIATDVSTVATIGYYVYFLGMDAAVFSTWRFMHLYCELGKPRRSSLMILYTCLGLDVLQYIINPFIHIAFEVEPILVEKMNYYSLVVHPGQIFHRIVCYGIFIDVMFIVVAKLIRSERIYAEKFVVMILSMVITAAVETYYIFSKHPLDASMIGFGVFGILVYVFALHYRPMKLLDKLLASMASDMPEALFFFDVAGTCIWINDPARKLVGIADNDFSNVKADLEFLYDGIDLKSTGWSRRVVNGVGADEQYLYLSMRSTVDEEGKVNGSYLSIRDITEDQQALKSEMYNATHDSLTDFFTKEYLFEMIDQRLRNDKKTEYMIAYIEIANLKIVSDVFGSKFGDYTVKKVADFILERINKNYLYGRYSDEAFGVLIDKKHFDKESIEKSLLNFTVKDDNMEHHILIHSGIYEIDPEEEIDVPLFFESARLATTMIKDNYKDLIVFYDDKLRNEIIHNQMISNQLRGAIEARDIRPYLQPIVDSRGMLAGAEALVRWIHPEEGFMNPGQFIPVLERNGLISEVDKYMWKCACEILADWKSRGIDAFISINISPRDFYYLDVVTELKNIVEQAGIDPVKLRVEITETVMVSGTIDLIKIVNELRTYGFIVEMDDFGSGYSSLNLLKDMNIDVIKIDMKFLQDSETNLKAGFIIKNIINMSSDLKIDTLTEGVETAKQFEKLYDMGCNLYQGYYFSKPKPLDEFEKQWFD
ncbi:MAG: EAL domain-containing protein [Saccharofermentans sp.]|nr:EAL domain-containing protein [Saccharofermentans sp.]